MLINIKFQTISLTVVLGPNKIMNMKNSYFVSIFAYFMPSLTNFLYVCWLGFLKTILEVIFMSFYIAKYTYYF